MISEKTVKVAIVVALGIFLGAAMLFHPAQQPDPTPAAVLSPEQLREQDLRFCMPLVDRGQTTLGECLLAARGARTPK